MDYEKLLIKKFKEIKIKGWIKTKFTGDECLGDTFEFLVGKQRDNKSLADFHGIELKSHRELTDSLMSLFSKSPSYPKSANTMLRENFGIIDDVSGKKKLYVTISSVKYCPEINDGKYSHRFKISLDEKNKKIILNVYNLNNKLISNEVYWEYKIVENALKNKLKKIAIIYGNEDKKNKKVKYTKMLIFEGLTIKKMIEGIKKGDILIDLRIGVYASGKKQGKTHDHGTGFRIKLNKLLTYGTNKSY